MCKRAVENNILIFRFYPVWFVKPKMLENADNDELVEWWNDYKQSKTLKALEKHIGEVLLIIVCQ